MLEIYVNPNILRIILDIRVTRERNLTSDLILFRPVMKVKYINKCKSVFGFKYMGLFLICQ